jgi:hypothetical protein
MTGAVILACEQGLGYMAKDFYDNGVIQKVFIHPHSSRKNHPEWYRPEDRLQNLGQLLECDSIVFFENPFYWKLIPMAREKGVKTVLFPMYECTPYPLFYEPDLILSPSALDKQYYPNSIQVTIPVDVKWKQRTKAKVFIHNGGNLGLGGRNGTAEVLEAMQYVKSPIKLIVRSQIALGRIDDPRVEIQVGTVPKDELWSTGDVFLFPEKFNGLSLPLQEAFASGMGIMCGERFPMTEWLPRDLMIPVASYKKEKIAVEFDSAVIHSQAIAKKIDEAYDSDISKLSTLGREWGKKNSWKKLGTKLTTLCAKNP